jgi:RNA polymerase primary sigma factor
MQDSRSLDVFKDEAGRLSPLTMEQEQVLAVRIQGGDKDAEGELVKHNLQFAIMQSRRFRRQGVPEDDLASSAVYGMCIAAHKFKPLGIKFISYAVHYIRSQCQRCISQTSRATCFPANIHTTQASVLQWMSKTGKTLADITDNHSTDNHFRDMARDTGKNPDHLLLAAQTMLIHKSLTSAGPAGDSRESIDLLIAESPSPDALVEANEAAGELESYLSRLSANEQNVVRRMYLCGEGVTLDEVGSEMGLSRERIRQIKVNAFNKMRHLKALDERDGRRERRGLVKTVRKCEVKCQCQT